ncbi:hypothetical protein Tco_1314332 [Tanacetum coccineum]
MIITLPAGTTYLPVGTTTLPDEHEFPDEEQPLPLDDSPTAESPGYVTKLDPENPEDDADGEDEDDEDEEEEEEYLAPADSAIVVPVDGPIFPSKGIEPVIPPPSTDITIRARITVRPQASISLPPEAVALIDAVTAVLPSPPLPPLPPTLYIPPPVDRRDDIPKSKQPPRKRLYLSTLGSKYERFGYVLRDPWVDPAEAFCSTDSTYDHGRDANDGEDLIYHPSRYGPPAVDLLMGDRMTLQETVWMVKERPSASERLGLTR